MNLFLSHLDWVALSIGTVGSLLWAHNGRSAKYAAVWWLAASLLWICYSWLNGLAALGARDVVGVVTTLYGCHRWLPREKAGVVSSSGTNPFDFRMFLPRLFRTPKRKSSV